MQKHFSFLQLCNGFCNMNENSAMTPLLTDTVQMQTAMQSKQRARSMAEMCRALCSAYLLWFWVHVLDSPLQTYKQQIMEAID